jgi:16S rRNA (guanine1516-N2)-methyltransferase
LVGLPEFEVAISAAPEYQAAAQQLSLHTGLPLHQQGQEVGALLVCDAQGVHLQQQGAAAPGPVKVDFVTGATAYRRVHGGGAGQAIAKAIGLQHKKNLHIYDATAGMGTDSLMLASLGCRVAMTERNPVVAALLHDGLQRALRDNECHPIATRMTLHAIPATQFMQQTINAAQQFDVVFLDPMFPHDEKNTAQVKKNMQVFRSLVGRDEDADELLPLALQIAKYRVVVKRPRKSPYLNQQKPSISLEGKANRFDIYVNQGMTGK